MKSLHQNIFGISGILPIRIFEVLSQESIPFRVFQPELRIKNFQKQANFSVLTFFTNVLDIWLPLLIIILGSFTAYAIIDSLPETESENSSSGFTDKWCLRAVGEENWKEFGYLKGDFPDELVCREDLTALVDEKIIVDASPEKIRQALIEAGIIEN